MDIKDFFNNEYLQYSNSDNFQSIASYIDGFKPTQRKLFQTYYLSSKKGTQKVAQLAADMANKMQYLSGEVSAQQVLINMAKSFKGSNNIPLFHTKGHFGTRFQPDSASAPRYIFVKENPVISYIFKKEDEPILIEQYFEGQKIEYRFFIPIIPMILVNGSEGIGVGFAQKILPRNPREIIKQLIAYLQNKRKSFNLIPSYNGYKGTITKEYIEAKIYLKETKRGYNYFVIEDLPFNYTLNKFLIVLEEALEKNIIQNYIDKSENDEFYFEIKTKLSQEEIIQKLKLRQSINENFTCIDENNKIIEFKNVNELMKKYIEIRLEHYKKRKEYWINKWDNELSFLNDRIKFIKAVINEDLIINKRKKEQILKDCKKLDIFFGEEHLKLPISSLTAEKIKELANEFKKLKEKIKELKNKDEKEIWIEELNELKKLL